MKNNLYNKADLIFLAIVPFSITILLGDDFPKYAGENYELLRFVSILALTFLTITYIKRMVIEENIEFLHKMIENTENMQKIYTETYNQYVEDQKVSKELNETYNEQYRLMNERLAKLEEEIKK